MRKVWLHLHLQDDDDDNEAKKHKGAVSKLSKCHFKKDFVVCLMVLLCGVVLGARESQGFKLIGGSLKFPL